jgi:gluconolactonase
MSALALSPIVGAQQPAGAPQQGGGGGRGGRGGGAAGAAQNFGQPAAARDVTVTAIPGVVAAGAKWMLAWGGPDNADGLLGTDDGGLLFAQEQTSRISKLDKNDKRTVFIEDTHGTGAVAIDSKGRILGAARTCTDPGKSPDTCKEATAIAQLNPYKMLSDNADGKPFGRVNDLVVAKNGGVYFNGGGNFYMNPAGKTIAIADGVRSNGIMLSRDEKTLYMTNGGKLAAMDIQADGSVTNVHDFGAWEGGGGDGTTIDSEGRLYVSSGAGVQVIGPDGKYLGLIPSPRSVVSVAFAGTDKKMLYMVGSGAVDADGKDLRTPDGVRNNAKSLYKIQLIAQGFKGRAK